jgi:phospholipid/cholesterol/gamma-HCH transport system substrate-binding protein
MAKAPVRDLTVGVVAALGLAILATAVLAVGGESKLFGNRAYYRAVFPNTVGLVVGSPVLMAGVQVGAVSAIELPTDPAESGIQVELGVERRYAGRVRQDSQCALRISQYLSGEKYVEITPGSPSSDRLAEDSRIPLIEEMALLEQGKDIAENLNDITVSLREILGPMERGEGVLGQLIQNPEFGMEGLERLSEVVKDLESMTGRLRAGEGFVGRAIFDEAFAARIDDLGAGIENLSSLTACLAPGEGALCDLLAQGGDLQLALADLRDSAASLKGFAERLDSSEGLLAKLVDDPEFSKQLADDLARTLNDLASIAGKIDRGEGTLGALINERGVYEGAEEVLAGVNDSKFARWLLRHYRKKGIQAAETEGEE